MANRSAPKQNSLRAIREGQGLTLRYVADRAGLDIGHLSRIERGQAGLSLHALVRLAKALGLRDLVRRLEPYVLTPETREAGFPASEPRADENVDGKPTAA